MRILLSMLTILFFSTAAMALTLEEALELAIKNDDTIMQNYYLMESQKYTARTAFAPFLPMAGVGYTYSETTQKDKENGHKNELFSKASVLGFSANWNVFNGFQDWKTYRMGSKGYEIQTFTSFGNIQNVMLETKISYINFLKARNQLNVAQETLELLRAQKKIAEVSYNVGQFSQMDVLQVDVQLASTELDLLNAEIALKIARQQLEKNIGMPINNMDDIIEIEIKSSYPIPELAELYNFLEERSEMKAAKGAYEVSVLDREKAGWGGILPSINLGYNYNWYGDKLAQIDGIRNIPGSGVMPGKVIFDSEQVISLNATWNIFSGAASLNTYLSKSAYANSSAHAVNSARKNLRLQLSSYYENYFSARERQSVAEVGVKQATENYRVTNSRYENSEATTTDLLNASVALSKAKTALASANYDIVAAVAQLERAVEKEFLGLRFNR